MTNTKSKISFGISVPQIFTEDQIDLSLVRSFATQAEALGYESLWVQEKIIGEADSLEPINLLSYLSAITKDIRLGIAVIIATTRNPFILAKELGTLDNLSGGRLILGYALGGRPDTYSLLGAPGEKRVRHFNECLSVLEKLWTQEKASFQGEFWNFENVSMLPLPIQKPRPPIWFGGRHEAALKRSVRRGNGWMGAGSTSTSQFRDHCRVVKLHLNRLGRDESKFTISKRVYVAVDDDENRALKRLTDWFGSHYGNPDLAERVSLWGSAEKCILGMQEVLDSGAEMLMFNPVFDHMEHLEILTSDIIPNLRPSRHS